MSSDNNKVDVALTFIPWSQVADQVKLRAALGQDWPDSMREKLQDL